MIAQDAVALARSVYMYHWRQLPSAVEVPFGAKHFLGFDVAPHAVDLIYFWNYVTEFKKAEYSISHMYIDYFTAFANGNVNY